MKIVIVLIAEVTDKEQADRILEECETDVVMTTRYSPSVAAWTPAEKEVEDEKPS